MAMETSGLASMKASAAFSTSGWNEVAPEQEMEPESVEATSPVESAAVSPVPPQPTRPRPATAATTPERPRN